MPLQRQGKAFMRAAFLCGLMLVLLPGCRKKTYPPFFSLDSQAAVLVAREGDDAYVSEDMDAILRGLDAVPEDAREKERAVALTVSFRAERARVQRERVVEPTAVAPVVQPPAFRPELRAESPSAEAVDAAVVDAGPPEPYAGMPLTAFLAYFGSCFSAGPDTTLEGQSVSTQRLNEQPECQRRHGANGEQTSYVFVDGKVWGKRSVRTVDAGTPRALSPTSNSEDAAIRILTVPGAPLPEGFERQN
jgi:hypothetical protein